MIPRTIRLPRRASEPSFEICAQCAACWRTDEGAPFGEDCAHTNTVLLDGAPLERLAKALRFVYGTPNGERRPIHMTRNDWRGDAQELLKVVGRA